MVEPNICRAFRAIGFEFKFYTEGEQYWLLFDEQKPRQNEVFGELRLIDFPLDQLSSRTQRKNARFGWLNKEEARIKWFGRNGCLFYWSAAEIWSCVRKRKSGIVAVFPV
jgi:hypothetical protein